MLEEEFNYYLEHQDETKKMRRVLAEAGRNIKDVAAQTKGDRK